MPNNAETFKRRLGSAAVRFTTSEAATAHLVDVIEDALRTNTKAVPFGPGNHSWGFPDGSVLGLYLLEWEAAETASKIFAVRIRSFQCR